MSNPPPQKVIDGFLSELVSTIEEIEERLIPVVRGSTLLRHWFGDRARVAADLDLECFHGPDVRSVEEQNRHPASADSFGAWGEFSSLLDLGRAMCRYAADYSESIRFEPTDPPSGGSSLWEYGTPGERYYTSWLSDGDSGILQIDIAEPGNYELHDLATTELVLTSGGRTTKVRTYAPETMLAAKLMWLWRGLQRQTDRRGHVVAPLWSGEAKDIFDFHLLLTQADLGADRFQESLVAFCGDEDVDWNGLLALVDVRSSSITEMRFPNWNVFVATNPELNVGAPLDLLRTIADRLLPLLGHFHDSSEIGFIQTIAENRSDEYAYHVYADYLEQQGDPRCEFLREFSALYFHSDDLSDEEVTQHHTRWLELLRQTSRPWLMRLWSSTSYTRDILPRMIEGNF